MAACKHDGTAGERDVRWFAGVGIGVLLLLSAAGLLATKFTVLVDGIEYLRNPFAAFDPPETVSLEGQMPPAADIGPDDQAQVRSDPEWERSHASRARIPREVSEGPAVAMPSERSQRESGGAVAPAGLGSPSNTVGSMVEAPAEDRHWPATRCISVDAASRDRHSWVIRNTCNQPVAVVFATCAAFCDEAGSWQYANPAPALRSAAEGGAEVVRGVPGRAEHLACFITAPTAVSLLGGPGFFSGPALDLTVPEQIELTDECMRVALSVSRFGASLGRSPLLLFR